MQREHLGPRDHLSLRVLFSSIQLLSSVLCARLTSFSCRPWVRHEHFPAAPHAIANTMSALAYYTHTLDRANLGNAKTVGIEDDLGMVNNQYSLVLVAFYITYTIMTIPWTVAAKRFSPAVVMPILIAGWGICTIGSVAVK